MDWKKWFKLMRAKQPDHKISYDQIRTEIEKQLALDAFQQFAGGLVGGLGSLLGGFGGQAAQQAPPGSVVPFRKGIPFPFGTAAGLGFRRSQPLPTRSVKDSIFAWRRWQLHVRLDPGRENSKLIGGPTNECFYGPHLGSTGVNFCWPGPRATAHVTPCPRYHEGLGGILDNVAGMSGIYATKDRLEFPSGVIGEVELWGKIVAHADGYRAEHCMIRKLYLDGLRCARDCSSVNSGCTSPVEVWCEHGPYCYKHFYELTKTAMPVESLYLIRQVVEYLSNLYQCEVRA